MVCWLGRLTAKGSFSTQLEIEYSSLRLLNVVEMRRSHLSP